MRLRFYRRLPIVPGVRLNLGTRGVSLSLGHRGAWYTIGPHGRRTATLGWPGTGLRYTTTTGGGTGSSHEPPPATPRQGTPRAPSAMGGLMWILALVVFGIVIGRALR